MQRRRDRARLWRVEADATLHPARLHRPRARASSLGFLIVDAHLAGARLRDAAAPARRLLRRIRPSEDLNRRAGEACFDRAGSWSTTSSGGVGAEAHPRRRPSCAVTRAPGLRSERQQDGYVLDARPADRPGQRHGQDRADADPPAISRLRARRAGGRRGSRARPATRAADFR